MLDPKVAAVAKELFKDYYQRAEDISPPAIEKREFGFGDFEKKIAYRHLSFKNAGELKKYILENSPPFISYSTAEYEKPEARPMENKIWKGSELIFDLDATDLHLPCQEQHGRSWVCDVCLSSVKTETIRLIEDFLIPDFGFSEKEIRVNFSGNRGYHVHVTNESVFALDSRQRRQISEYITGTGISPDSLFELRPVHRESGTRYEVLHGPMPTDGGWGGRIARNLITALNTGVATLEETGIKKEFAKKLFKNRASVILGISRGNWDTIKIPNKAEFWGDAIKTMAIKQSDSIDRNVTNDTHHLIRLPNTIHGDTGLVGKKLASIHEIGKFEPMKDSVAFRHGIMKIHVVKSNKFTMLGEEYGPYENQTLELPVAAAMYLLLKRTANIP